MMLSKNIFGFKLYYQGAWDDDLFTKCIAVVGSRRMTEYGHRVIEKIVPQLVQDGWTIISGFMYGVDQAAHRECVAVGGKTVAVLGWGIEFTMTPEDQDLANKIIQNNGLLLSLWDKQKPALWTFPARNEVVAALAQEVIVIEAAAKSGSLITVEMARKRGKKIWAVPGPITSRVSEGTNQLIADKTAEIFLLKNHPSPAAGEGGPRRVSEVSPVLRLLENEPLDASEIARKLNQSVESIGAQLSLLVLSGSIKERAGKYYAGEN